MNTYEKTGVVGITMVLTSVATSITVPRSMATKDLD
jgi:hypothetical protein